MTYSISLKPLHFIFWFCPKASAIMQWFLFSSMNLLFHLFSKGAFSFLYNKCTIFPWFFMPTWFRYQLDDVWENLQSIKFRIQNIITLSWGHLIITWNLCLTIGNLSIYECQSLPSSSPTIYFNLIFLVSFSKKGEFPFLGCVSWHAIKDFIAFYMLCHHPIKSQLNMAPIDQTLRIYTKCLLNTLCVMKRYCHNILENEKFV